jgi:NADPH:quinone reductase-like Zn-dependent oxidoreductase
MIAVIIDEFGGPEVLRVGERDLPEPGAGQVRVRVQAAGVNGIDAAIRSGEAQQMFPTQLPAVLGLEIAGVVDAVGPGIEELAVGEEVLGFADGGGTPSTRWPPPWRRSRPGSGGPRRRRCRSRPRRRYAC